VGEVSGSSTCIEFADMIRLMELSSDFAYRLKEFEGQFPATNKKERGARFLKESIVAMEVQIERIMEFMPGFETSMVSQEPILLAQLLTIL
jgi:hypothetical protein